MTDTVYPFVSAADADAIAAIPVDLIAPSQYDSWQAHQTPLHQQWMGTHSFNGSIDSFLRLPAADGKLEKVAAGYNPDSPFSFGAMLYTVLNGNGVFKLTTSFDEKTDFYIALGWAAAAYRFTRYKKPNGKKEIRLVIPDSVNDAKLRAQVDALYLVRDLINTPANDLGPADLANEAKLIAESIGATYKDIIGDDLLDRNFPAIHAVGRAAAQEPRLIDITWGNPAHPRLALIGKGVTYDTGGLSLKPSDGMFLMKKDMGGAAHALALLKLIAAHQLPVFVHLLIPAVENSIGSKAYRPSDIISSRAGLTIEINNTDAEGRVIMSDCFAYACESNPDFVVDFATLTGHARSVIGYETGIVFANDTQLVSDIIVANDETYDNVWPLPLKREYAAHLYSHVADISNMPSYRGGGGAIHAALFLERFLKPNEGHVMNPPWIHVDCSGWTQTPSPGRPIGGEACGLRTVFQLLQQRYK